MRWAACFFSPQVATYLCAHTVRNRFPPRNIIKAPPCMVRLDPGFFGLKYKSKTTSSQVPNCQKQVGWET